MIFNDFAGGKWNTPYNTEKNYSLILLNMSPYTFYLKLFIIMKNYSLHNGVTTIVVDM